MQNTNSAYLVIVRDTNDILKSEVFIEFGRSAAMDRVKNHHAMWQKNLERVARNIPLEWYDNRATTKSIASPSYEILELPHSELEKVIQYFAQMEIINRIYEQPSETE